MSKALEPHVVGNDNVHASARSRVSRPLENQTPTRAPWWRSTWRPNSTGIKRDKHQMRLNGLIRMFQDIQTFEVGPSGPCLGGVGETMQRLLWRTRLHECWR